MSKSTQKIVKPGVWHAVSLTETTQAQLDEARAIIRTLQGKVEAMVKATTVVPAGHVIKVSTKYGKLSWAVVPQRGAPKAEDGLDALSI